MTDTLTCNKCSTGEYECWNINNIGTRNWEMKDFQFFKQYSNLCEACITEYFETSNNI